uniref:Uncharacterized protein n=1 Tax=Arundo donax TaxID=35708 RepID=A0A0A9BL80_ARUDO
MICFRVMDRASVNSSLIVAKTLKSFYK